MPSREIPKQQLCPLPSPWLAPEPCPVPGCAHTSSMESPGPAGPGGEEGAEPSRLLQADFLPAAWTGAGGRSKTPPFPPFQRERAAVFGAGPGSGMVEYGAFLYALLPFPSRDLSLPTAGLPALLCGARTAPLWESPGWDVPMQQGWMGRSALELAGDLGQDLPPLLLCWWLLGHGMLVLAPSLCQLCSALGVVPLGGFPCMKGHAPKLG